MMLLVHSVENLEKGKKVLYNFSVLKYNAAITHSQTGDRKERIQ